MRDARCALSLALWALLLVSCSGGENNATGPGDNPSDPVLPEPKPANVTVTLDPARIASVRVPTSGGTLEATGADGTVYTLTIPPDALLADTTITMTPLTDVAGLQLSGGRFVGVQLEPDGLRFFQPATLRVAPPEGAHQTAVGFSYHGNGAEAHPVPLTPDPDLLEMPVLHFSGKFIYLGNNIFLAPIDEIRATDPEDRVTSELAEFLREERRRALVGEEPDPSLGERVETALRAYYRLAIQPSLARMQTDCGYAETAEPRAMSWVRQVELWGAGEVFAEEENAVVEASIAALRNCFEVAKGDCLDTSDPLLMETALLLTRQLELLGAGDDAHNALNPDLQCSRGWNANTRRTLKLNGFALTDEILGEVQWEIDTAASHPGIETRYRVSHGRIRWEQKGTDVNGCTHQGGPLNFDLTPQDGQMVVDEINHTYQATGIASHFGTVTVTCPPGQPSYTADASVGDWLITPALPFVGDTLRGTWEYPTPDNIFEWEFKR
jgi:hypothetical protein